MRRSYTSRAPPSGHRPFGAFFWRAVALGLLLAPVLTRVEAHDGSVHSAGFAPFDTVDSTCELAHAPSYEPSGAVRAHTCPGCLAHSQRVADRLQSTSGDRAPTLGAPFARATSRLQPDHAPEAKRPRGPPIV